MKKSLGIVVFLLFVIETSAQLNDSQIVFNPQPAIRPNLNRTLTAPVQVYPSDGSVFRHFTRHIVLVWDKLPEAASYSLEVDCFHCCKRGAWCTDVGQTWMVRDGLVSNVFDFSFVGAQPGRWRVWAVDENGQKSEASEWRTFKFLR